LNLPQGYAYSAVYAGIRQTERDDLALIVSGLAANAAAVFTRNRVQAAPVRLCRLAPGAVEGARRRHSD
jgi:glutamate N-acetyltransferase/amino-acid N-acetyltransferase